MKFDYPEIGICGLSCKLCPTYNTQAKSKCDGCKSEYRMGAGCPFITCAVKKKGIEFCWLCEASDTCEKWQEHRQAGRDHDSFKCYQTLERDIDFIKKNGIEAFNRDQEIRAGLLTNLLNDFNEGRSKSYYCIVVTVLKIEEIKKGISLANDLIEKKGTTNIKEKSKILHSIFDNIGKKNEYSFKLRSDRK